MRKLAILACLLLSVDAQGAGSVFDSGSTLLPNCKDLLRLADHDPTPPQDAGQGRLCIGYISGFIDGETLALFGAATKTYGPESMGWTNAERSKHFTRYCLPEDGVQGGQAVRVVVKYMEQHPELLHLPAKILVNNALMAAFPCK